LKEAYQAAYKFDTTGFNTKPSVPEMATITLANKVSERDNFLWMRSSIPTLTMTRILQLIRFHHDNYLNMVQYPLSKRSGELDAKVTRLREECIVSGR